MKTCPKCKGELKLVPQAGDIYSCAKCKEFWVGELLKEPDQPWHRNISSADGR